MFWIDGHRFLHLTSASASVTLDPTAPRITDRRIVELYLKQRE